MADQATLAVVVSRLDDLREDLRDIRITFEKSERDKVSRGEWEQRNTAVDARFEGQGREIAQLRASIAAAKAPWWSVAAVITAVGSLAWTMFR